MCTIIAALKEIYKDFKDNFSEKPIGYESLDLDSRTALEEDVAWLNIKRIIPLSLLLLLLEVTNVGINLIIGNSGIYNKYCLTAGIVLAIVSVIYLFIASNSLNMGKRYSVRRLRIIYRSFWILFILCIIAFSVNDIVVLGTFNNTLLMFLTISLVPMLTLREVLFMYCIHLAIISHILVYLKIDLFIILQVFLLDISSLVISQMLHNTYIRSFVNNLKLANANKRLETLSDTDPMTGFLNRRGLDKKISVLWPYCLRNSNRVAVIILDIDYFKKYNDQYGHVEGDRFLKKIAGCIKKYAQRATDILARIGGEEFLIMLYDMEAQEVLNLARSIKDGVENLKFGCLDGEACFNATISLGISYKRVTLQNSFIELYEEADVSLYKAKRNGRNTIVFGTEIYK